MPSTAAGAAHPAEPSVEPEVLSFGPESPGRRRRRIRTVAAVAAAAVLAGFGVWQLLPTPPPDFTAADLSGVYAGMVRSDGQNEVSVLDRSNSHPADLSVTPAGCSALFAPTQGNAFPAAAVDGVSTYWLNEGAASISLFTYRYPDTDTAEREYDMIAETMDTCRSVAGLTVNDQPVQLAEVASVPPDDAPPQIAFLSTSPQDSGRFATQVFQLSNTITWQYRYDYGRRGYDPAASQQLTNGLVSQMTAVQAMHT